MPRPVGAGKERRHGGEQAGLAADHGLLLFHIIVDGAIGFHLFDLLEAGDGAFDRGEISEGAAEPAFGDIELSAFLGGFFDCLLGLFLGADKEDFTAFADGFGQEVASRFQLVERLA